MKSKVQSPKSKVVSPNGQSPARRWLAGSRLLRFAVAVIVLGLWTSDFGLWTCEAQTVQFLNAAPSVYENGTNVTVIVTRTPASGLATVDYTTVDDSALAGSDYQFTSGTLTFNDGESFQIITIPIIDDKVPEGTEDFFVTLSNPTGAVLGLGTNIVTIFDDDTILRIG